MTSLLRLLEIDCAILAINFIGFWVILSLALFCDCSQWTAKIRSVLAQRLGIVQACKITLKSMCVSWEPCFVMWRKTTRTVLLLSDLSLTVIIRCNSRTVIALSIYKWPCLESTTGRLVRVLVLKIRLICQGQLSVSPRTPTRRMFKSVYLQVKEVSLKVLRKEWQPPEIKFLNQTLGAYRLRMMFELVYANSPSICLSVDSFHIFFRWKD